METCPNCSTLLEKKFAYCPTCGQSTHTHRFNLPHVFHEVFHALTHADKGVLHLLKELAIRPGIVAREYVLEGKRKTYFNPFTFLLLMLGLTLFVNSVFHPYTRDLPSSSAQTTQSVETQQAGRNQAGYVERRKNLQTFLEKRTNFLVFFTIPLFALIYWLFFLRSGINYAEHFVALVFFSGFNALLSLALLAPLKPLFAGGDGFSGLQLLVQFLYLSFAYYQFIGAGRRWRLAKASFATLLALIAWILFSFSTGYVYIRYGG